MGKWMAGSKIARTVERCISDLCEEFYSKPTLFYTENDLVCRLHSLLHEKLTRTSYPDKDGNLHSIVHTEYPTPFKCDMDGTKFEVVPDDATGPRRGEYDLIVLNPEVIKDFDYEYLKAKDYNPHGKKLKQW